MRTRRPYSVTCVTGVQQRYVVTGSYIFKNNSPGADGDDRGHRWHQALWVDMPNCLCRAFQAIQRRQGIFHMPFAKIHAPPRPRENETKCDNPFCACKEGVSHLRRWRSPLAHFFLKDTAQRKGEGQEKGTSGIGDRCKFFFQLRCVY